nr:hypothetical protein [uncultured Caldimonas sp.]
MTGAQPHHPGAHGGTRRRETDADPFDEVPRSDAGADEAVLARFLEVSRRYLLEAHLGHDERGRVRVVFPDAPPPSA